VTALVLMAGGWALRRWGRDWARYGNWVILAGWLLNTWHIAQDEGWGHLAWVLVAGTIAGVAWYLLGRCWRALRSRGWVVLEATVTCPCGEVLHTRQELTDHRRVMHPNDTEETP